MSTGMCRTKLAARRWCDSPPGGRRDGASPPPTHPAIVIRRRGRGPLFPDSAGGWRDPSNTSHDLRLARGSEEFSWVISHVFRKTGGHPARRGGAVRPADRGPARSLEGVDDPELLPGSPGRRHRGRGGPQPGPRARRRGPCTRGFGRIEGISISRGSGARGADLGEGLLRLDSNQ
jgi:hypothetical protein